MTYNNAKQGFTLIELLVVVLIIGILAAVALPQYQKAVLKAKFSGIEIALRAIYNAAQVYHLEHRSYPGEGETGSNNLADLDIEIPACKCFRKDCISCSYTSSSVYGIRSVVYYESYARNGSSYAVFIPLTDSSATFKKGTMYSWCDYDEFKSVGFTNNVGTLTGAKVCSRS